MMRGLSAYSRGMVGMTVALAALVASTVVLAEPDRPDRIVTLGGAVTEIAYELGQQHRLAARDTTSSFPAEAEALPDVGYLRALSPEGVLSVNPDLVVAIDGAGPPEAIDVLESAEVPFVMIPEGYTHTAILEKIRAVGAALGEAAAANALAERVGTEISQAVEAARENSSGKRVLFILSTQGGRILASGTGTAAAGIIEMAGGVNAVTAFEGYKPLTDEAVTLAAPDVILMMDRGGEHAKADDDLFAMPAIATTPAAETRSIVRMDGLHLLGFGPRTATAVSELAGALNGERAK